MILTINIKCIESIRVGTPVDAITVADGIELAAATVDFGALQQKAQKGSTIKLASTTVYDRLVQECVPPVIA